jgi:hypothetical protein
MLFGRRWSNQQLGSLSNKIRVTKHITFIKWLTSVTLKSRVNHIKHLVECDVSQGLQNVLCKTGHADTDGCHVIVRDHPDELKNIGEITLFYLFGRSVDNICNTIQFIDYFLPCWTSQSWECIWLINKHSVHFSRLAWIRCCNLILIWQSRNKVISFLHVK